MLVEHLSAGGITASSILVSAAPLPADQRGVEHRILITRYWSTCRRQPQAKMFNFGGSLPAITGKGPAAGALIASALRGRSAVPTVRRSLPTKPIAPSL